MQQQIIDSSDERGVIDPLTISQAFDQGVVMDEVCGVVRANPAVDRAASGIANLFHPIVAAHE